MAMLFVDVCHCLHAHDNLQYMFKKPTQILSPSLKMYPSKSSYQSRLTSDQTDTKIQRNLPFASLLRYVGYHLPRIHFSLS